MTNKDSSQDLQSVLLEYSDLPEFLGIDLSDVNTRGNFGDCPIHVASIRGSVNEVSCLLKHGADVNAKGDKGHTPLHYAASGGHLAVVKMLLRAGARTDVVTEFGDTPAERAESCGYPDIEALIRAAPRA
jgi:ankyrin repeat protein